MAFREDESCFHSHRNSDESCQLHLSSNREAKFKSKVYLTMEIMIENVKRYQKDFKGSCMGLGEWPFCYLFIQQRKLQ